MTGLVLPLGIASSQPFLSLGDVPLCVFKHLTGVPCPLCGGIRVCAALAQADLPLAFSLNPGLVPLIAVATLHSSLLVAEAISGRKMGCHRALMVVWKVSIGVLLMAWLMAWLVGPPKPI